jgi:hypothetical protein
MMLRDACSSSEAPAALYFGEVMHARLKPLAHRFSYRVMSLLIDLNRLDEADRQSPLFGINRAALYSFHEKDHGGRDGSSLRAYAQRCAAEQGISLTGGRVMLLCYPRLLGYTFNPLSVYFCHGADDRLVLIIYEVRNTFGEIHSYAGAAGGHECGRRAAGAGQAVLCLALRGNDDALSLPHFSTRRTGEAAHPGDRFRRPPARRHLFGPPPSALDILAASRLRGAAAGLHQDCCSDPLASAAVVAQGRPVGAPSAYRICEGAQYLLGERQKPRLYIVSAIRPRGRALVR